MLLEQLTPLVETSGFCHFRQRFRDLLLGMKDVAELVDQEFAKAGLIDRRRALGDDGRGRAGLVGLDGR